MGGHGAAEGAGAVGARAAVAAGPDTRAGEALASAPARPGSDGGTRTSASTSASTNLPSIEAEWDWVLRVESELGRLADGSSWLERERQVPITMADHPRERSWRDLGRGRLVSATGREAGKYSGLGWHWSPAPWGWEAKGGELPVFLSREGGPVVRIPDDRAEG